MPTRPGSFSPSIRRSAEGQGVLRIGLAHYNTADEVDQTLAVLRRLIA